MYAGRPDIEFGRSVDRHWWLIGGGRIELFPTEDGWTSRISGFSPAGLSLTIDGVHADETEGVAWCERMATVLARDIDDARAEEQGDLIA